MASLVFNTFPQAFLEVLHHSLHVGRNCCYFFPDVLFQIHHCPWFLFVYLALEISSEEEVLRLGTLVPMNIELPTKYPLSQDRIVVFEIRLHSKGPMLHRPALHGNWNALSFARSALKDKFPTPTVPLRPVLPNRHVFLLDPVDAESQAGAGCCWKARTTDRGFASPPASWKVRKQCRERRRQDGPRPHLPSTREITT